MNRKSHNNFYRSGRGRGGGGYRRFGGTGSLGNYKEGADCHNGRDVNRNSGSWGAGNFKHSFKNSRNKGNNNNSTNDNAPSQNNQNEDRFHKFRDPNSQEQRNNNMRSPQDSQQQTRGRRGSHNRDRYQRGGNQNYGNEDRGGANTQQIEQQSTTVAPISQANTITQPDQPAALPPISSPIANPTVQSNLLKQTDLDDKKLILKNIKQEKLEQEKVKQVVKPPPTSSSSSSSSESSDSEAETPSKPAQEVQSKPVKIKQESCAKSTKKNVTKPSSSSSSSSSSEEDDESDNEASDKSKDISKPAVESTIKTAKKITKPTKEKESSEEDLICLGKLEKKFVIEDDAPKEFDKSESNQCLICDKEGHTALECQMICKNCSEPYHNMKSCPKPANLSTVMKCFMEFCMGQISQFNPEQKFTLPSFVAANTNNTSKVYSQITNAAQSKKGKKVRAKSKEPPKKLAKRKRRRTAKSSDEEEDDDEEEEDSEEDPSSESESENDSSEKVAAPKSKKKRTKALTQTDPTDFHNSFVPQFSTFPTFGAAAAAYNPLLLGQLMHGGGFGTPKTLNFQ